eukprot:TRINITY_DN98285_c0_g1_i1.p1 TRINITY_DN98285_c0_g1~~TRINITY_DN98285_c0_g1_i1.p1  ORF type:complete len:237 (-),score=61.76 TRINITY_DN98285_c0_g1_i1:111-821(-)
MASRPGGRRGSRLLVLAAAAGVSVWAVSSLTWLVPSAASVAAGRREALLAPAAATALALASPVRTLAEELEPLPPPVVKDLKTLGPKIQAGVDWFYFEVYAALQTEDVEKIRESIGGGATGSHVSPLETELVLPLNSLASANIEADEDGWTDSIRSFQKAQQEISDAISEKRFPDAVTNWRKGRDAINRIFKNINARAEKPPFVLVDDNYKERKDAYFQKKKDMMNFRNAAANVMR